MKKERRSHFRLKSGIALNLHFGVQWARITLLDAGAGGLSFEHSMRFKANQRLVFSRPASRPRPGENSLKMIGIVIESKPGTSGYYRTRIRFDKSGLALIGAHLSSDFRNLKANHSGSDQKRVIHGITFLKLTGDYAQRAAQYSTLLRKEIQKGPLNRLASRNQSALLESGAPKGRKLLQKFIIFVYEYFLIPFLVRVIPKHHRKALNTISTETLIPARQLRLAYLQPEGFMLLLRLGVLKHLLPGLPLGGFPGCSSVSVLPDKHTQDSFYFARNQDYPIVDSWEKSPVVSFHFPSEAHQQNYISIASAGIYFSGLTGINESGIAIALHAHFGRRGSLGGKSILALCEKILTHAESIQDAIDIARDFKVNAAWSICIASRNEKNACVIEIASRHIHVRYPHDGVLCNTNVFISKKMRGEEGVISGGATEDFSGRFLRLEQIFAERAGHPHSVRGLIDVLSDMTDYYSGEERVFGNTIGTVTTIKSVIFDLFNNELFLGNNSATPVSLGEYVRIPIEDFWVKENPNLQKVTGSKKNGSLLRAISHFREAYIWWHVRANTHFNRRMSLKYMIQAARLRPKDPHLHFHIANILFKFQRFSLALKIYRLVECATVTFHLISICKLQIARLLDISGDRAGALALYSEGGNSVSDNDLAKAYLCGVRKPYTKKQADSILIDLQFPGIIQY